MAKERSHLKRLFSETFPVYKGRYALALVFMAIVAAATALFGWIIKDIINGVFGEKSMRLAYILGASIMAIFLVKGIAAYAYSLILARIGNDITAKMQSRLFKALMHQGLDYHIKFNTADSLTRLTLHAASARHIMQLIVTSAGRDMLTVIGLLFVLIVRDPLLFIASIIIMPLAVYGVNTIRKRVKKVAAQEFEAQAKLTSLLQESLQGIRVVKSFSLENNRESFVNAALEDVKNRNTKIQDLSSRTQPLMEMIGGFSIALVIMYGAWRVIYGGSDAGSFFSFLFSLLLAYEPAKRLARLNVQIEHHLAGVKLMYDVLDAKPNLKQNSNAHPLKIDNCEIKFNNVNFAYFDEKIINNLTLTFEGNKTTALIGGSGSGKTTLLSLIHRFFDPQTGEILIDNQNIKDASLSSFNASISYVAQDNFLFQGTIKDNIRYGKLDASDEEIILAAKNAYAHEFILEQPKSYETVLGEFGAGLSGGQKQRIAIARAFLKNAPILLLDEATSALDTQSEQHIQKALTALTKDKTTIIIAHRLSTIKNADKVIILENGKVLKQGTPKDILQNETVLND